MPSKQDKARQLEIGIWGLSSVVVAAYAIVAGFALVERQPTADETIQRLYEEFVATNPDSLDGWTEVQPSAAAPLMWLAWTKDGMMYLDRNADGLPDRKIREQHMSTTVVYWEDTDYDGVFDTEVERQQDWHRSRPVHWCFVVSSGAQPVHPILPSANAAWPRAVDKVRMVTLMRDRRNRRAVSHANTRTTSCLRTRPRQLPMIRRRK